VQVMGFHYDGGFAQYVLIPANGVRNGVINKIPPYLSFNEAVLTEPLACSINMQDAVNVMDGDTVVIYGAGPLGRLNARLSRMRGAKMIILIEIDENRLASVSRADFDYCINPGIIDPIGKITEITDGKGADVVIPCCPSPEALGTGFKILAKKGRFGFFSGLIMDSQAANIDINLIHYKELMVYGAYGCSTLHNQAALKLLSNGKIQVKDMITRAIALDEVSAGIEMIASGREIKIVINY
ncbi:MAG TPA: zinc-binding dehydrogenase, partial [Syntrophomonadaceae bacterium]|nr:zinc-binding dehydrogenase [Syntrophomonadaceae bacterium]